MSCLKKWKTAIMFPEGNVMNGNETQGQGTPSPADPLKQAKTVTTIVYALQAGSFVLGVTSIAAIIINYLKREDVQGTWLASHFRWQIRTFWFGLLWGAVGAITALAGIGFVLLGFDLIWVIYRIVKGWLRLSEGKEMYAAA
jgi:uncharacterized membrane protein